jgi:hypothetical protein
MDVAAAAGDWDRATELANDVLTVDPRHERATSMAERGRLERSLPEGQWAFVSLLFADIVQSTDMARGGGARGRPRRLDPVETVGDRDGGGTGRSRAPVPGGRRGGVLRYPPVHEDDARRAVLAGLRLVERTARRRRARPPPTASRSPSGWGSTRAPSSSPAWVAPRTPHTSPGRLPTWRRGCRVRPNPARWSSATPPGSSSSPTST